MLFVKKNDGSVCLYIDYMELNKRTLKNKSPLPRIEDLFDQLREATMLTYDRLPLDQERKKKKKKKEDVSETTFRTRYGYEFVVISF